MGRLLFNKRVGGSVFGNNPRWIVDAIAEFRSTCDHQFLCSSYQHCDGSSVLVKILVDIRYGSKQRNQSLQIKWKKVPTLLIVIYHQLFPHS